MDRQAIIEELRIIIGDYLKNEGFDLVDLICRYEGRDLILRVLTDRPEGDINLDECARLNRGIGEILDGKNILEGNYVLEVSSPGLDRPLKTKSDFLHCLNKKVRFFLSQAVNGKIEWEGSVINVSDILVNVNLGETVIDIPLEKINKAKQLWGK